MSLTKLTTSITITVVIMLQAATPQRPYPQEEDFSGCIKPNNVSQSAMNSSVTSLYDDYKSWYLKSYGADQYYVQASGEGPGGSSSLTISEAHGYGMIILALMAGYDANAQTEFDGMYRFFDNSPSESNSNLMSWIAGNVSASSSATDGDMDIAYALILAHYQWGSTGSINYLQEAQRIITNGIKRDEMGSSTKRTLLGDWDTDDETTRSSDWMTGHMRAFEEATGDTFWGDAADTVYSLVTKLTNSYAPNTGLMPDFIDGANPYPDATGGGTGEANADEYWYNACRFPWRIAIDYAHNGTAEAKTATSKVVGWLRNKTNSSANNITAGYTLSGNGIESYNDLVFTAPFAAGAITDPANQAFLNSMWSSMKNDNGGNEYAHALNILSMLLISGNWWAPGNRIYANPNDINVSKTSVKENQPAGTFIGKISTGAGEAPYSYSIVTGGNDFTISNDSLFTKRILTQASDNPTALRIQTLDNQNNTHAEDISIAVTPEGESLLNGVGWWVDIDTYGQSTVDTGSALMSDTSVKATFSLGISDEPADEWVYGALATDSFNTTLENSSFITIEYRSNKAFTLTLPMSTVLDYAYYAAALPVSSSWTTLTLDLTSITFTQPVDWGDPVAFDPATVQNLSFDAAFENESGFLEIRFLEVEGVTGSDPSPVSENLTGRHIGSAVTLAGLSQQQMTLTVPQSGLYDISIYSVKGQRLAAFSQDLSQGMNNVAWQGGSSASGIVLIKVTGLGKQAILKSTLQ